jgi:hypothetical protein
MRVEEKWYSRLRAEYKPERIRLLLIGESAPSDHDGTKKRNFFYANHLGYDNLYRGVVQAMYGLASLKAKEHDKVPWLRRLQADGVFLIDLVPYPVNDMKAGSSRKAILVENVTGCVERAAALEPEGIILCSRDVFTALAEPLRRSGLPLLHDEPLSFPLGNMRSQFVAGFSNAFAKLSAG